MCVSVSQYSHTCHILFLAVCEDPMTSAQNIQQGPAVGNEAVLTVTLNGDTAAVDVTNVKFTKTINDVKLMVSPDVQVSTITISQNVEVTIVEVVTNTLTYTPNKVMINMPRTCRSNS
jgi:hypothetical protein